MKNQTDLAQKLGIEHPAIDRAVERGQHFFSSYIDQGCIPYGDHGAYGSDDSNGKNTGIAFGLKLAPQAGMNETELAGCIDWVSRGFEVVFSPFPGWRFSGADCAAAFGLHSALYLGPRLPLTQSIINQLPRFRIALVRPDGKRLTGCGADVLDGPLRALGYLLDALATDPGTTPIGEGEIISTGTLN